eukprot:1145033-Pelagomonas_calceolata.AAC.1
MKGGTWGGQEGLTFRGAPHKGGAQVVYVQVGHVKGLYAEVACMGGYMGGTWGLHARVICTGVACRGGKKGVACRGGMLGWHRHSSGAYVANGTK